jgi:phosphate starvation-inducible PhoH-like protein
MTRKTKTRKAIQENLDDSLPKDLINNVVEHRVHLKFKNQKQKEFAKLIEDNEIIICSGPAGVGKSFLAIATALELIQKSNNSYKKLIIVNPNVVAGHTAAGYGHIKGTLREKLEPLAAASLDIIDKLIGEKQRKKLEEEGIIKLDGIAYIRGKTMDNTILILEEAQNTTPSEIKTLLTRIGINSKFIISGDLEQSDLFSDNKKTGLYDAMNRFKTIDEIKTFTFDIDDVVRNPIISKILKLYIQEVVLKPILLKENEILPPPMPITKPQTNKKSIFENLKYYLKW